jgi:hypothetical protein
MSGSLAEYLVSTSILDADHPAVAAYAAASTRCATISATTPTA